MSDILINSPVAGELIPLDQVRDPVFSEGIMGRGAAVKNPKGKAVSPFDGEVTALVPSCHAIGLRSVDGVELLIHVGIDTINLEGKCFKSFKNMGDKVRKGDTLITFETESIEKLGYDTVTPIVVTNEKEFDTITIRDSHREVSMDKEGKSVLFPGKNNVEQNSGRCFICELLAPIKRLLSGGKG